MNIDPDPREWIILEEDEKHVVFATGDGVRIRSSKKGTIYKEWLKEMKRIADGGPVVEMEEGESIEPVWMVRGSVAMPVTPSPAELIRTEAQEAEDKAKQAQRRVDREELSEIHRRLEQLRRELRDRLWCQHERNFCSGSCQIVERIRELEKQCLGGRE
jgi:hypothetical protein